MNAATWKKAYLELFAALSLAKYEAKLLEIESLTPLLLALGLPSALDESEVIGRLSRLERLALESESIEEGKQSIQEEVRQVETAIALLHRCLELWEAARKDLERSFASVGWDQATLGFELETKWIVVKGRTSRLESSKQIQARYYEQHLLRFTRHGQPFLRCEGEWLDGGNDVFLEHASEPFATTALEEAIAAILAIMTALRDQPKGATTVTALCASLSNALADTLGADAVKPGAPKGQQAGPDYGDVKLVFNYDKKESRGWQLQGNYSFPLNTVAHENGLVTLFKQKGPTYDAFTSARCRALEFCDVLTKMARDAFTPLDCNLDPKVAALVWPWGAEPDEELANLTGLFTIHVFQAACHRWFDPNKGTYKDNFGQLVKTPPLDIVRQCLLPHTQQILATLFARSVIPESLATCRRQIDAYAHELISASEADIRADTDLRILSKGTGLLEGSLLDALNDAVEHVKIGSAKGWAPERILALSFMTFVPSLAAGFYASDLELDPPRYQSAPTDKDRHKSMRRLGLCPSSNPVPPQARLFPTSSGGQMTLHSVVVEARHGNDIVSLVLENIQRAEELKTALTTRGRSSSVLRSNPK